VVSASDAVAAAGETAAVAQEMANPEFYVHGWEDKLNPDDLRQLHIEDEGLLVSDIMTPRVYTVKGDAPISEVARTMVDGHVHRLLVEEGGEPVGIVSTLDLLRLLADDRLRLLADDRAPRAAVKPVARR
jgi:signal-transduction protein with cAMP-binding, CBS, and nucleotidyltransferase domain